MNRFRKALLHCTHIMRIIHDAMQKKMIWNQQILLSNGQPVKSAFGMWFEMNQHQKDVTTSNWATVLYTKSEHAIGMCLDFFFAFSQLIFMVLNCVALVDDRRKVWKIENPISPKYGNGLTTETVTDIKLFRLNTDSYQYSSSSSESIFFSRWNGIKCRIAICWACMHAYVFNKAMLWLILDLVHILQRRTKFKCCKLFLLSRLYDKLVVSFYDGSNSGNSCV